MALGVGAAACTRSCQLRQLRIAVVFIVRRCVGGQAKAFAGPGTKVNVFAALATKRSVRVDACVNAVAPAGGASHQFGGGRILLHGSDKNNSRLAS